MSSIDQLRKDFEMTSNTEQFNQIRPTRPLRRNQSQQFDNITSPINNNPITSQTNNNPFTSPINYMDKSELILPKNIKISNNQIEHPKKLIKSNSTINFKNSGFNPKNHIPPKYDIYGYLKPFEKRKEDMAILEQRHNIKIPWETRNTNKSGALTRSELIKIRRKERIPDPSYDLDQDGYVGNVDLVLSKRFDVDNDGK